MYIIGITGQTGAGKTSALKAVQSLGALTLDCDDIYHELLLSNMEMTAEIQARFSEVITDGKVDRQKLGAIVLSDPEALLELSEITHKYVIAEINRRIDSFKAQGGRIVVIDAVLLIESGQGDACDVIIGITAPIETRISRIIKRDGITREQSEMRLKAQQSEEFYIKNCDHILDNTYSNLDEFEDKCKEFFNELLTSQEGNT